MAKQPGRKKIAAVMVDIRLQNLSLQAIVLAIVEAHGGELELRHSEYAAAANRVNAGEHIALDVDEAADRFSIAIVAPEPENVVPFAGINGKAVPE